ncbi:MAG: penicillin-binding protein 2 [Venatoribacter sp.]
MRAPAFRDHKNEKRIFFSRSIFMGLVMLLMFIGLAWRMAYLQITLHEKYHNLSENNRLQLRPITPNRGLIYDRNGVLLAENIPSYSLTLTPERVRNIDKTLAFLDGLIGLNERSQEQIEQHLKQRRRPFEPIVLRHRLNEDEIAKVMVNRAFLPGIDIEAQLIRHYPLGKTFAHSLGYVGRINQQEQAQLDTDPESKRQYSGTHYIGKLGLEKRYEKELHGEVGHERVETNARGRVLRVVDRIPPKPGQDLTLHLDSRLQLLAEKEMKHLRGAVVAIDVESGGIVAYYSNPSFDPNLFVTGISFKDFSALRDDIDLPLYDRAVRGQYPPASTIKPFMGLAVLNSGSTSWSETVRDYGRFQLPNDERIYRDWKRGGHGIVNLERAIVESCDIYFYEMAVRAGIDNISPFLAQFGFGQDTTYDVINALSGILPDREWKRSRYRSFWFAGDTVNMGIGQGFSLVTPMQLATATSVLANKGRWNTPHLVSAINDIPVSIPEAPFPDIELKNPNDWQRMNQAMSKVVSDVHGTAHKLSYKQPFTIAGKTGTAQVVGISQDGKYDSEALKERQRDHALFIAYAPAEKPKIALAVIIENGESASRTAGPIAQSIINQYLGDSQG